MAGLPTYRPGSCAALSARLREDPAGSAPHAERWLFVEQPGPWGRKALYESGLPVEIADHLTAFGDAHGARIGLIRRSDKDEGRRPRRVLLADCRRGRESLQWASFRDPGEIPPLLQAVGTAQDAEPGEGSSRSDGWSRSDGSLLLVCTNGKRDQCCALHGNEVYAALRQTAGDAAWETSHLGGHRFAANVLTLPSGYLYGRISAGSTPALVDGVRREFVLADRCRGRTCDPPEVQAADVLLRRQRRISEISALAPIGEAERRGEEITVRFVEGGTVHTVVVACASAAPPRIESCGASDQVEPDRYELRSVWSSSTSP